MGRRKALFGLVAVLALLLAAEPAPARTGGGFRTYADVPYAPAEPSWSRGHLLDLYVPDRPLPGGRPRPVLIVMGGSGWFGDDGKAYAKEVAPFFTAAGFVVAGVSTRSSRQARFPAQVYDVKAAIRWLRAHSRAFGIDRRRFAAMGDSSGGWTAAMAALAPRSFEGSIGVRGYPSDVQAVIDLYGPMDFRRMDRAMIPGACDSFNRAFGLTHCHADPHSPESSLLGCPIDACPSRAQRANPISYVSSTAPPFLIVQGDQDLLVPPEQSDLLYAALAGAHVPATLYLVPGVGHSKGIVSPAHPLAEVRRTAPGPATGRPTLETIERFLHQSLRW